MKTKVQSILTGAVFVVLATVSEGVTIVIDASDPLLTSWTGNQTSQTEIENRIYSIFEEEGVTAEMLYKRDVPGKDDPVGEESGPLAGSYTTLFDPEDEPSQATITYDGGALAGPPAFLLVKDGRHEPAWYLYNLTSLGWNGTDTLSLTGFWVNADAGTGEIPPGGISHVSLYGSSQSDVPDGGSTLILLGSAFLASASLRRWFVRHA